MWSRFASKLQSIKPNFQSYGRHFKNGSFEIALGTFILSIYAYDRYLLSARENETKDNRIDFDTEHRMRQAVLQQLRQDVQEDYEKEQKRIKDVSLAHLHQNDSENLNNISSENKDPRSLISMEEAQSYKTQTLFQAKVRKIPYMFDGTMSLKGTHLNDILDVIQENVGPSGMYHLCRFQEYSDNQSNNFDRSLSKQSDLSRKPRVGWFPISHLEKLD